jgi:phosphoglucosamine mutase
MGEYFGTDGIRGLAGRQVTCELALNLGKLLGWYYGARCGIKCNIAVGGDTRISSSMLQNAVMAGITSVGGNVYNLGVVTTPAVCFAVKNFALDCGVVISASHNAFYDNGIKIISPSGGKAQGGITALIEAYMRGNDSSLSDIYPAERENVGRVKSFICAKRAYLQWLKVLGANLSKLKIGLDCANGAACKTAVATFKGLNAEVYSMGVSPNGTNINAECGSLHTKRLQQLVKGKRLDVGFAFDGDGDRCICVDERGNVIDGDGILYALALYLKAQGRLKNYAVVMTEMSNGGVIDSLKARGVNCIRCAVGDSNVGSTMEKEGVVLGGEQSGHIIFGDMERSGDGIVTAVMLANIMVQRGCRASALCRGLRKDYQVRKDIAVDDKDWVMADERVLQAIAAEREFLKDRGRVLVRKSGTESVVRIMAEGKSERQCNEATLRIAQAINGVKG